MKKPSQPMILDYLVRPDFTPTSDTTKGCTTLGEPLSLSQRPKLTNYNQLSGNTQHSFIFKLSGYYANLKKKIQGSATQDKRLDRMGGSNGKTQVGYTQVCCDPEDTIQVKYRKSSDTVSVNKTEQSLHTESLLSLLLKIKFSPTGYKHLCVMEVSQGLYRRVPRQREIGFWHSHR